MSSAWNLGVGSADSSVGSGSAGSGSASGAAAPGSAALGSQLGGSGGFRPNRGTTAAAAARTDEPQQSTVLGPRAQSHVDGSGGDYAASSSAPPLLASPKPSSSSPSASPSVRSPAGGRQQQQQGASPTDSSSAGGGGSALPAAASASAFAEPYAPASSLPHTPLSLELERRVRERLQSTAGPEVASSVVVRMVSSLKKSIRVPPEVRAVFTAKPPDAAGLVAMLASSDALSSTASESVAAHAHTGGSTTGPCSSPPRAGEGADAAVTALPEAYAEEYNYRQRVILLWQRLDGVDVCLFALYVQEYGADCPPPNARKIYIAYLDSVRYLRPLTARTAIYHELLVSYLSNARQRGYASAYIWA